MAEPTQIEDDALSEVQQVTPTVGGFWRGTVKSLPKNLILTPGTIRTCSKCNEDKPHSDFPVDGRSYCRACKGKGHSIWWRKQTVEKRRYYSLLGDKPGQYKRRREKAWKIRLEMITAYGGKCVCCGIDEPLFLTLEHLNGGGREHRRRLKTHKACTIYEELKRLGWPSEYTILCYNCNSVKGQKGICPHEQSRKQS